jgi:hypothetical protein
MNRLFKVTGPNGQADGRYYDNKHSAKTRRDQLNEGKAGHSVRRGPDHRLGETDYNTAKGRV